MVAVSGEGAGEKVISLEDHFSDEIEEAMDSHPAGKGVSDERRALMEVAKWSNRVQIARNGYRDAVLRCRDLGIPNTEVAYVTGKTEAAIRMYLRRWDEEQGKRN